MPRFEAARSYRETVANYNIELRGPS
jgi:hypothetical protein